MTGDEVQALRAGKVLLAKAAGLGERFWRAEVLEAGPRRVAVRFLAGPRTGHELVLPLSKLKTEEQAKSDREAARSRFLARAKASGPPPTSVLAAGPLEPAERIERALRTGTVQRGSGVPVPKPRGPARSDAHLARVRAMPCCVCSAPAPSDPHHFGPRGMGQKTSDFRVVPLCRAHHDEWHAKHACAPYDRAETTELFLRKQVDVLVEILEET